MLRPCCSKRYLLMLTDFEAQLATYSYVGKHN